MLTVDKVRQYFRVEHVLEDEILEDYLRRVTALIETYVHRPVLSTTAGGATRTYAAAAAAAALAIPSLRFGGSVTTTVRWPGSASLTATPTPLDQHPDFAWRVEPVIELAQMDIVGSYYQRRNTDASYESAGGGLAVTYPPTSMAMSPRAKEVLDVLLADLGTF